MKRRKHCERELKSEDPLSQVSNLPIPAPGLEKPLRWNNNLAKGAAQVMIWDMTGLMHHCRYGIGKWRLIQKDEDYGPQLVSRSNVDLKVSQPWQTAVASCWQQPAAVARPL